VASPVDIEQPACFYLGREYDLARQTVLDKPVMYDARDLTTHGVVVGMTGSGKTGLCINLLEEAAIDGIPCILIDPKGDLTNLLLQFPDLAPADFERWLNPEDARQRGVTLEEHGRQLSEEWRKGLAEWGQAPERIARLRDSSEWRIYTPGSEAGLPLSILSTFTAPKGAVTREALNQKIDATTTALLGLTGISADPVQSREHILIAQLLLNAWTQGKDLDLPQLISQIQAPPLRKIGAFDVDTFYPEKDRLKLAVALNNILAAPSFSTWITGEALDLSRMMYAGTKPRQLIFYIAHLEDAQRLFFLTLLLEEVLSWTRKQPGTTNLRAIVYFDEVFGYLPPHTANPPTKTPLMTLLKQARAFGVGILLATQNPVDLDYKALSNAGTWFVGKLQTERDKARLLEGLEGVAAERGSLNDRAYLETAISALGSRTFLLHDVHRNQPLLFKSRWALCFLRGPMTRDQVALLMEDVKKQQQPVSPVGSETAAEKGPPSAIPLCTKCQAELQPGGKTCPACGTAVPVPPGKQKDRDFKEGLRREAKPALVLSSDHVAPVLKGVAQFYLPLSGVAPASASLVYQPRLLGFAEVVFADKRRSLEHRRNYRFLAMPPVPGQPAAWQTAEPLAESLAAAPQPEARWADAPESLNAPKKLAALQRAFADYLYGNVKLTILTNRDLELVGTPGEDVLAFQQRCRAAADQMAQKELLEARAKAQPRFEAEKLPFPEDPVEKHGASWLSLPLSLLGLGGSSEKAAPVGDKEQARKAEKRRKLESDYQAQRAKIIESWRQAAAEYSEVVLKPRKSDVQVTHFGLAWTPFWQVSDTAGNNRLLPAYK
jgi:hypothetical protein